MRNRVQLGALLVMSAMVGGMSQAMGVRVPSKPKSRAKTQADIDALDRAEAKRARKAAKLREHGL